MNIYHYKAFILENNQEKQVFYPKLWWRILALLIPFISFFIYLYFSQTYHFNGFQIWLGGSITGLLFAYGLIYALRSRLIADENGLQLVGFGKLSAQWKELTEITLSDNFLFGLKVWGIYYYSESKNSRKQKIFLPVGYILAKPPHKKRVVKVNIDWANFKATEFGQILYQQAPQLFPEDTIS